MKRYIHALPIRVRSNLLADMTVWFSHTFCAASEAEDSARFGYFLNQAKIRAIIAIPICIFFFALYLQPSSASDPRKGTILAGSSLIAAYALTTLLLARKARRTTPVAHLLTILLDSAAIAACVGVTGAAGQILIWLFLFITLGNGFRFGPAYLHACQVASLGGLAVVLMYSDHWRINLHQWFGAVLTLIVVPAYANGLLRKLRSAIRKAEEASNAKSNFLARMSHELRTPLNGMLAAADLLRETPLSAHQAHLTDIVHQAGRVLLDEIRDVLDISKIEANQLTLEVAPFRLSDLFSGVQMVLSQAATARRLELFVEYDEIASATVLGDQHHLRQVLMNLTGNALKFTQVGSVRLRAKCRIDGAAMTISVSVDDTGIGIPDDKLQKIFEPFRQADESTTRKFGGTGLGLSIARQLVRLMGGDIAVKSEVGKGTTFSFTLTLPLSITADPILDINNQERKHGQLALAPLRVLVADDNDTNLEVMRLMLERDGHTVTLVRDGEEALQELTQGEYNLAILDHNMPKMSGLEAIRIYRTASANPIPTLIASADATPKAVGESAAAGATEHICKPIVLEALRAALLRHAPPGHLVPAHLPTNPERPTIQLAAEREPNEVIDVSTLLGRLSLSSDPAFGMRLIDGYLQDVESLREEIHGAFDVRDVDRIKDAAHALKGGSATIGAVALFEFSKRLQAVTSSEVDTQHLKVLAELNALVRETRTAIYACARKRESRETVHF